METSPSSFSGSSITVLASKLMLVLGSGAFSPGLNAVASASLDQLDVLVVAALVALRLCIEPVHPERTSSYSKKKKLAISCCKYFVSVNRERAETRAS